ncbi:DnaJ domain-containing protein [Ferrovibrio sp.]|uniref:DnaJ domain-containing protein n=1 Tax=Ferrovibrio sp. TaxID=1917215 RepID=UPI000CCA3CA0|nr:DnaJ domain-containing protein [Ferrovibrio sp.]PJI37935.1 MAG: molecular chaperone DnaJ [Ferrovibrio sp.]
MAAFFALGIVGLILLLLGARGFLKADPKFLAKVLKIAVAVICGGLAVLLLVRGRIDAALMLGAVAAAALGYLPRSLLPFNLGSLFGGRGLGSGWQRARTGNDDLDGRSGAGGQQSNVETAWLRMQLDHATGRMDGDVLQGRHAGRRLSSLSFEELILLLRDCQSHDNQAAALLEAYLDRSIGEDWRERATQGNAGETASPTENGSMTREQAWDVLGLQAGAPDAEIRTAHRRLMKKFHPDQGGSTYLAAQINRAKDLLLGE